MAVIDEIREQKKKAFQTMNTKEKIGYIWYYYKIHILVGIAAVALIAGFIQQYVTNKPYGFYASFVDASVSDYQLPDRWADEFAAYAPIDTDEYLVFMDTSVQLGDTGSQYTISSQEKMLLQMQTGEIQALVADSEVFESYAQNEFFRNLESILTDEQIAKYRDFFYYTDASTVDTGNDDTIKTDEELESAALQDIDHRDPSTMKNPVPVGIIVTDYEKIRESGFYLYLSDNDVIFQQHPSEAVFGVPVTLEDPTLAIRFLEFLEEP